MWTMGVRVGGGRDLLSLTFDLTAEDRDFPIPLDDQPSQR